MPHSVVRDGFNAYFDAWEADIGSFLEFDKQALAVCGAKAAGLSPLSGLPFGVKDNIAVAGMRLSCGSKLLSGFSSPYSATAVTKLREAGAVPAGKTNMDEFGMGSSTDNSAFRRTNNPWDPSRVAGGSSGGSAAAVAAGLVPFALGSDTGGSVRQPASFCGVVGLKPTYGAVSRRGVMAMASSLDQVGPIAKTIDDAKLVFDIIRGKDDLDATSWSSDSVLDKNQAKTKLKIGVPREFVSAGLDPEVAANFEATLAKLKTAGHEVVDIELPSFRYALACYYVLMPAEASTNLARFDGLRYGTKQVGADLLGDYQETRGTGFGPEVRRRIILGTYVLSAGYADEFYYQAVAVQRLIKADYARVFKEVDVIATPTAPGPAFKIGEKIGDPLAMYLEDIFTVPVNIGGVPAVSVPSGQTTSGLPLGVQLTAGAKQEEILFALGRAMAA